MVLINKVADILNNICIKPPGMEKDFCLLSTKVKLNALDVDPNDPNVEIFRFFPHKIEKVMYLRDIEDKNGNGIVFLYSDDLQGFHHEVVYVNDICYKKLCDQVNHVKILQDYKKLISDFILAMSDEDHTLTLIEAEKVTEF